MTIILFVCITLLYILTKFILKVFLIKTKRVYCTTCKYSMPFIYTVCQEDCYHKNNIILNTDTEFRKTYRTKYLDENGTCNKNHSCKYYKIGVLYKIYLYFKIKLLMSW